MTGNMIKGKGFRGALRYNLEKVTSGVAEVLDHSFVEISEKSIMKEVQMVKVMRPNLQKYFYHTSINFPPSENLSNNLMKQIGQEYLVQSGFTQHQYIMFRHRDADHPHLHILVNRIGFDGKVMSDSNDFARCEKILRDLETKYNLTEVVSSKQAKVRALTKDELEMMKRTNTPSHKMSLQVLIKDTLTSKPNMTCLLFVQALEVKGINVQFNQASTGFVSGISYSYKGTTITGSKLGNDFKWNTIKNNINYEQERDRGTIHQANARTKSILTDTRPDSIHPDGNTTNLHNRPGQQQATTGQHENSKHGFGEYQKTSKRTGLTDHRTKTKTDSDNNQPSQDPNKLNLAALLDGDAFRDLIHADHQPNLEGYLSRSVVKKRKRRKRI